MDVAPNTIGNNIGASTLLGGSPLLGTNNYESKPPSALSGATRNLYIGTWLTVPDDAIIGQPNYILGGGLTGVTKYLKVGGKLIPLDESEFSGIADLRDIFMSKDYTYHNCRVMLTANTLGYFWAMGQITDDEYLRLKGTLPPAEESVTTQQAVVKASTALVILAVLGAAIWFVPKGVFR